MVIDRTCVRPTVYNFGDTAGGYHTLSHAYLNLEEACKNDLDVPVAFNAALLASEPLIKNAKTTFYHA